MWILLDLFNNKIVEKEIELKKLNSKKSNIQFQVGACFYFNKHTLIDDKDADQVMIKSYLSCKPLIDHLFK